MTIVHLWSGKGVVLVDKVKVTDETQGDTTGGGTRRPVEDLENGGGRRGL